MGQECPNNGPDAGGTLHCPEWCASDHSDYDEAARACGDLIWHEGKMFDLTPIRLQFGEGDWEPWTVQRYLLMHPDGTVVEDGERIGDHSVPREEAVEVMQALLEHLQGSAA